MSSKYEIPKDTLKSSINKLLNKSLPFSSADITPGDYRPPISLPMLLEKHFGSIDEVASYLDKIISLNCEYHLDTLGWIPANPTKKGTCQASKDAYFFLDDLIGEVVGSESKGRNIEEGNKRITGKVGYYKADTLGGNSTFGQNTGPSNIVNTKEGDSNFRLELLNCESQVFPLIGKKGIGKTFYLNYLINCFTDDFYKNRIVIYRADISKIYQMNISQQKLVNGNGAIISISDYLNIQIPYVTYKYRHRHPIWEYIWNNTKKEFAEHILSEELIDPAKWFYEFQAVISNMAELEKQKQSFEGVGGETIYDLKKDQIAYLLENVNNTGTKNFNISDAILSFLRKKNFRILLILDGLDNIDYYRHRDLFKAVNTEIVGKYLNSEKSFQYNENVILCIRSETDKDLIATIGSTYRKDPKRYYVETMPPDKLIEKKLESINGSKSEYHKRKKNVLLKKLKAVCSERNVEFKRGNVYDLPFLNIWTFSKDKYFKYLNTLKGSFNKNKIFKYNELSQIIFNDNVRDIIINFINTYKYAVLLDIHKHEERRIYPLYAIVEGMLLNGKLWIDSGVENRMNIKGTFGNIIPNIFWYDYEVSKNQTWQGLCLYRILQNLQDNVIIKKEYIFKAIIEDFKYDRKIIDERIETGICYGLIGVEYNPETEDSGLYLTEKGKFILQYIFHDINILYYLALDSPLPKKLTNDGKHIKFYSNSRTQLWKDYSESCIYTAITFARVILQQHKLEMKNRNDNFKRKYPLPDLFKEVIVLGVIKLLENMRDFKSNKCKEIVDVLERGEL